MKLDTHVKRLDPFPAHLVEALLASVNDQLFIEGTSRKAKRYSAAVFREAQHIMLKFPKDQSNHLTGERTDYWDRFVGVVGPAIAEATRIYGYVQGDTSKVMFAKVSAGARIYQHRDVDQCNVVPHRIHVPLQTDPEARFFAERADYYLEPGYAWEVNNRVPHSVVNRSGQDRIHLIFDFYRT